MAQYDDADAEVDQQLQQDEYDQEQYDQPQRPASRGNSASPVGNDNRSPKILMKNQTMNGKEVDVDKQYDMGSYLKPDAPAFKMSSAVRDAQKFGKQVDPEKQTMEYGSYLKGDKPDIYHAGKVRDANKFGSNKEIFDEQKLQYGSFLQKNLAAQQEHAAKEAQKKQETIAQLKQEAGYTYLDPEEHIFPYAELKNKFPKGVDPIRKEYYLPDDEFEQLFGMCLADFENLPPFKKRQLKMKLGLF